MAKSELYNNPLIPIVLVAGILSGSLWRGNPPADTGKPGDSSSSGDKSDGASAPVPWVSDLRPVLESLDGALGARAGSAASSFLNGATAVTLAAKDAGRDQQILEAMVGLRTGLDRLSSPAEPATCGDGAALQGHASVLGALMLADDGGDGKTRAAEARALLDEFRDWRLLADLATGVKRSREGTAHPTYSVDFIVATIPDYVDSNSGWMADQALAATQSAMAQGNYLFDRVRLVDWSRASAGPLTVLSGSRLHERQPGAIIFRHVAGQNISMQVVLTVLETPTAGVHQVALRNSLRFLRTWNACTGVANTSLRVLGPSFSGSTVSLAMRDFRSLAFAGRYGAVVSEVPRNLGNIRGLVAGEEEVRLGVRPGDLVSLEPLFAVPSHVSTLETEMGVREHAAIIQSEAWFGLWRLSDSLVTMLQRTAWRRGATTVPARAVRREAAVEIAPSPGVPLTATAEAEPMPRGDVEPPHPERSGAGSPTGWFARCEQLVALQMAFVLRDIVARTITCLFAAMLCLTSLTAAHLLYVFNGRASLLTVDMLAVAATALSAVWILVDMERDHVLSRLRTTTPGRVDINWEFIKRLAVYGVLPLLAVIASLFPEVGGTLFGWLEPLRKLSSF